MGYHPASNCEISLISIGVEKTLKLEEISCYRLEWPILEFQPVKGVHIRSCEAGNVLSPFRCSIEDGSNTRRLYRAEENFPLFLLSYTKYFFL